MVEELGSSDSNKQRWKEFLRPAVEGMREAERKIEEQIQKEIASRVVCLPPSRLVPLAIRETTMTPEEESHVRNCEHCHSWVYREQRKAAREISKIGERIDYFRQKAGLTEEQAIERIRSTIREFGRDQWAAIKSATGTLGLRQMLIIGKALGVLIRYLSGPSEEPRAAVVPLGGPSGTETPATSSDPVGTEASKPPADPTHDAEMEVRDYLPAVADEMLQVHACGDAALERWLEEYAARAKPYWAILARVIAESCLRKNHKGAETFVDQLVASAEDVEERLIVALLRQGHQRRHVGKLEEAVEPLMKASNMALEYARHGEAFNALYELGRLATEKPALAPRSAEKFIQEAADLQAKFLPNRIDFALRVRYADLQRLHKAGNYPQVIEKSEQVLRDFEPSAKPGMLENILDYVRTTLGVALRRRGTEEARRQAQDIYQRAFTRNRPKYYQGMCAYLEGDLNIDRMLEAYQKLEWESAKRHHAAALECCTLAKELLDKTGDVAAQQKANSRLQWLQNAIIEAHEGKPERTFALREFDFARYFLGAPAFDRPGAYEAGKSIELPDASLRSLIGTYSGLWVPQSETTLSDSLGADYIQPEASYVVSLPVGDQLLVRVYGKANALGFRSVIGAFALERYNSEILATLGEFHGLAVDDFWASRQPMYDDLQKAVQVATPLPKPNSIESVVILPPNKNEGWALSLDWLRTKDAKTGEFGANLIEVAGRNIVYGVSGNPVKNLAVRISRDHFRVFASTQKVSGRIVHALATEGFGDKVEAFDVPNTSQNPPEGRTVNARGVILMAHADVEESLHKTLEKWEFPNLEAAVLLFCQSSTFKVVSGPFVEGLAVNFQRRLSAKRPAVVIASRVPVGADEAIRFGRWILGAQEGEAISEWVTRYLKDRQKDSNPFEVPWLILC